MKAGKVIGRRTQIQILMDDSRRWAEDYVKVQQKTPTSHLYFGRRGYATLTPEQLTDLVSWVHYCGRGNPT